ncbi:MAG: two-component system, LytTR family, sensor kinase [Blastocatellia bacterium]|jgi:sensor histidine kinase YesM|nr:two-component system, LytTR family, sensor kinase [Blastocatellia bacterium]
MNEDASPDFDFKGPGNLPGHSRWRRLALIWGTWTFIGMVFTFQGYFTSYRSERPMLFTDSLYMQMTWAYLFALATPLVLWASARLPIEKSNWVRSALLHVPISIVLSCVLTALGRVLIWLNFGYRVGKPLTWESVTNFVVANFSEGIGIYLLIALTSYALKYYRQYREGQLQTLQLESQLSLAQLQALKMQLHPHFLFNTLHSISALLNQDPAAARKMITRLGDFLRLTLENSGSQEVTLEQEMAFLSCYLEIERIRFQNRLVTRIDVAPETLDAKVPNLILQPIVENAIRHGIAPRSTPGLIEIEAKHQNGTLRIQVRDNGPGLSHHRTSENLFRKGLGLANTKTRLERLYGAAHLFELSDNPDGGLIVTLEIPFHTDGPAPVNRELS